MTPRRSKRTRTKGMVWLMLVIGALFVFRLFWLQVVQHDYYQNEAQKEQVARFTIPAKRGQIYARDGSSGIVPLVLNEAVYTVYADPQVVVDKTKVVDLMQRVAGGNLVGGFPAALDNRQSRYAVLARQLNKTQAELIKQADLQGVGVQEGTKRVYPEGSLGAQLLGFVDADGRGQYGVEGALDSQLRGVPGLLKAVTDVRRIPLSIGKGDINVPAKDGQNLVLNVDRNIQARAEQALKDGLARSKATHGSVLIMDPYSGRILAMASSPSYNPDKYYQVKDYSLFQNRVVSEPYEAGSVVKTLTMGVGLDKGVIEPGTVYNNTGSVRVADFTIKNATPDSIGPTTMIDVLHYSLNTGAVFVLQQLGGGSINDQAKQTLYDYFTKRYRLGQNTGIEQQGEAPGVVIPPTDPQGGAVRYANMTFGQGMDVTMIQVASAFSAAINGGTYYKPQLVGGILLPDGSVQDQPPTVLASNVISPTASAKLQDMVAAARHNGFLAFTDPPGYRIGGKTGTSQIIDPKTGKYTNDNSIGTYLGFGGGAKPRYVIMVRVKDSKLPGYAGTVAAAPIFADISNWLLQYLRIPPNS
ncbi:MAG: penicillin-binding protein 2 [Candidatus Chaera renei]|uniref:Penicillin-binding protein 2 n=1 Tax=Candidatus Chaera renei TaxID=2506947 RepID=A0A4Q0AJ07_9BACT|nr:MAG: penicillin-binding protein 2 [Candidatus Chaera renei]